MGFCPLDKRRASEEMKDDFEPKLGAKEEAKNFSIFPFFPTPQASKQAATTT